MDNAHENEIDSIYLEAVASACRKARAQKSYSSSYDLKLYSMGTSFSGPILTAFVIWVLRGAHKANIKRLYFIARDGQILYEIARKLIVRFDFNIELKYLYGSRQAWFLPSLNELTEVHVDWLTLKSPFISLRILTNRTGLNLRWVESRFFDQTGLRVGEDENINCFEQEVRSLFLSNEVKARILANAGEQRKQVVGYFEQEGLFDEYPYGIVDLGWQGTMQDSMIKIINSNRPRKEKIYGFYYGLDLLNNHTAHDDNPKFSYHFATHESIPVDWRIKYFLEFITTGDHGITLGYRLDDRGGYVPVLKESINADAMAWGLQNLRLGIHGFIDALMQQSHFDLRKWDVNAFRRIITSMFKKLVHETTPLEAEIIGSYLLKEDPCETYSEEFAPKLKFWKTVLGSPVSSYWVQASLMRSGISVRLLHRIKSNLPRLASPQN
ncbi:MAG: hypothetical protein RIG61_05235 [Deltaproteobacteria bacterium]